MRFGAEVTPQLREAIQREKLDTVEGAFAYGGGEDLDKPNLRHRRRTRLALTDRAGCEHELYLKRYGREGLADRLRRWRFYGLGASTAGIEFDNIEAMQAASVETMQAVACGEQRGAIDVDRSYLIVTAVGGQKLEQCVSEFLDRHVDHSDVLWSFTLALAELVRKFHQTGYVHRDLYSAHVFMDEKPDRFDLCLIDLARVFAPKLRRFRWQVKDLAQLKYSMPRTRWADQYWQPFMEKYLATTDEQILRKWNRKIDRRVKSMRRRAERKRNEAGE